MTQWNIQGDNLGNATILYISYPLIAGLRWLGADKEDDYYIHPAYEGRLFNNFWEKMVNSGWRGRYPSGNATMQFTAFYDRDEGGFYLATLDVEGYIKEFSLDHHGAFLAWAVSHYPSPEVGTRFVVPYPVIMGVFDGDWQSAADLYKTWALRQWWAQQKIAEKTPQWLIKTSASNQFISHKDEQGRDHSFAEFVQVTLNHASELGSPQLGELWGWEKHGVWNGFGDYFPPYEGWQSFDAAVQTMRDQGSYVRVFIRHDGVHTFTELWQSEETRQNAIQTKEGQPFVDTNDPTSPTARMDIFTEFWREEVKSFVLTLVKHGANVQLDGFPHSPPEPCYSMTHGHPVGLKGNWYTQAWIEVLREIRSQAKAIDPDLTLASESIAEPFLPFIDLYHMREVWNEVSPESYGILAGKMEVVPLFSYVYHEYIIPLGQYNLWLSHLEDPEYHLLALARVLNWGNLPSYNFREYLTSSTLDRRSWEFMKSIVLARKTYAKKYLVLGKKLKNLEIDSPLIHVPLNLGDVSTQLMVPALQHSAWEAEDGSVGLILTNINVDPIAVTFDIIPETIGLARNENYTITKINGGTSSIVNESTQLPNTISLTVQPQEVVLIKITVPHFSEFVLNIPQGISLIHIPLAVTAVNDKPMKIKTIGDFYDALGTDNVSFLITYAPPDGNTKGAWRSFVDKLSRGTAADQKITDEMGILTVMKKPVTLRLKGLALGINGTSPIHLNPGINLVGIPLMDKRLKLVSDLLSLEGIKGNTTAILVSDGGKFKTVVRAGDAGDIPLTGSQSFFIVARKESAVEITGEAWDNVSEMPLPLR